MKGDGHVACMGKKRGVYRVLMGRPEERRPLGGSRCRWDGSSESVMRGMDWIKLAQDSDR